MSTALAGRYRVEHELGAGGMATVFLAHDVRHERAVAIKVLREDVAASVGKDRFFQEIRIAAALQHPHILPLYDSGEADGLLFYVMPFVDGPTLRDRLTREGELPIVDAVRILREMADALSEAHRAGIVHRDLKPENVILRGRHVLVTDFGVAKALNESTGRTALTTLGIALGTPAYMAPEQASGDGNLDQRADIYALGIVAYEMFAGRPPFTGTTPQQLLAAHVTAPPEPVTQHRQLTPPLAAVIMRCLAKRPADRWQSVDELLAALAAIPGIDATVSPLDTAPVSRGAALATRYSLPRVAAVVATIAGVAAIVWAFNGSRDDRTTDAAAGPREFIEVADFSAAGVDTSVARAITAAVRAYLADQAGLLIPEPETRAELVSLGAPYVDGLREGRYDERTVAELGKRAGWKAIVAGSVTRVGAQYLVQARLLHVGRDTSLGAARVEVSDTAALLRHAQELAQEMGRRAAVALPQLSAPVPLGFATTRSRAALAHWADGARLLRALDHVASLEAFRAALAADSSFARAAASLASRLWSSGIGAGERFRAAAIVARALDHLPPLERAQLERSLAVYTSDPARQLVLGQQELLAGNDSASVLNGIGLALRDLGRHEEAVIYFYRAARTVPPPLGSIRNNLTGVLRMLGRRRELDSLYDEWERDGSITLGLRSRKLVSDRRYADALALNDSILGRAAGRALVATDVFAAAVRGEPIATGLGRHAARERFTAARIEALHLLGLPGDVLEERVDFTLARFKLDGDTVRARTALDSAVRAARQPDRYPLDRRYAQVAVALAQLGLPARARAALESDRREVPMPDRRADSGTVIRAYAEVALAEGNWRQAVALARSIAPGRNCIGCEATLLARAFDRGGQPDSAIAQFERFANQLGAVALENGTSLPYALKRLGELYEAKGDRQRAIQRYSELIELWTGADAWLQPAVTELRERVSRLERRGG